MISPEILRRYSFFGGLEADQIVNLAKLSDEISVETGHYFFHEEDEIDKLYLTLEGSVAIVIEVPDRDVEQKVSGQLTGKLQTKDVVTSVVGPGEVFGWSVLVPPHTASASVKATTDCRVIVFDGQELQKICDDEPRFGYIMMQKIAGVLRSRMRDLRTESLAHLVE